MSSVDPVKDALKGASAGILRAPGAAETADLFGLFCDPKGEIEAARKSRLKERQAEGGLLATAPRARHGREAAFSTAPAARGAH